MQSQSLDATDSNALMLHSVGFNPGEPIHPLVQDPILGLSTNLFGRPRSASLSAGKQQRYQTLEVPALPSQEDAQSSAGSESSDSEAERPPSRAYATYPGKKLIFEKDSDSTDADADADDSASSEPDSESDAEDNGPCLHTQVIRQPDGTRALRPWCDTLDAAMRCQAVYGEEVYDTVIRDIKSLLHTDLFKYYVGGPPPAGAPVKCADYADSVSDYVAASVLHSLWSAREDRHLVKLLGLERTHVILLSEVKQPYNAATRKHWMDLVKLAAVAFCPAIPSIQKTDLHTWASLVARNGIHTAEYIRINSAGTCRLWDALVGLGIDPKITTHTDMHNLGQRYGCKTCPHTGTFYDWTALVEHLCGPLHPRIEIVAIAKVRDNINDQLSETHGKVHGQWTAERCNICYLNGKSVHFADDEAVIDHMEHKHPGEVFRTTTVLLEEPVWPKTIVHDLEYARIPEHLVYDDPPVSANAASFDLL
ncbi:hypothetical protein BKA62DRAFT_772937 [Auriculariales sp. MPI-PUGE-AT-0066]|nr:hypothetical protein BKA62DRAFT_772937 [Auriculariales sp. MPI-PUGE-AT-0066]